MANDRKLSAQGPSKAGPDHYSDQYLERKIRAGNSRACRHGRWLAPRSSRTAHLLLESEIADVIKLAGLTGRQRQVIEMIRDGLPERDVALRIGCSRSYAHQVRKAALAKLAAAYKSYRWGGLYQVYTAETRRSGRPSRV